MIAIRIVYFLLLLSFFPTIYGTDFLPSSAKLSTIWNVTTFVSERQFSDERIVYAYPGYILVISARINCYQDNDLESVLWFANRYMPATENATLQFNSEGDLILREVNGSIVWSTNTSGKSVVGMRITATGGLLLYDANNTTIWSSFDEQLTNTWLPGRKLVHGQRITATEGKFYLSVTDCGLCAFINSNAPQRYRKYFTLGRSNYPENVQRSIQVKTGSLNFSDGKDGSPISVDYISDSGNGFQYMRLDNDGHLRVYQWVRAEEHERVPFKESFVEDVFTIDYSDCSYPTVCGSYGICSDGQCTCPIERGGDSSYFKQLDYWKSSLGCNETTELSCNSSQVHLIEVEYVTYNSFVEVMVNTNIHNCKEACLNNCSCKAALFRSYDDQLVGVGDCSLPSQIFSFMRYTEYDDYSPTTFLKVQTASLAISPTSSTGRNQEQNNANRYATILGIIFGTTFFVILVAVSVYVIRNRIRKNEVAKENHLSDDGDDDQFDEASEMPRRFSYEELKSATGNFHKKIGRGGFGSVYEGIFGNETIAVKCLDLSQGQSQGRKQFLAEVKTIGSIHHVNLVKLVGFCAENSHKLLAYEYMCNGSLDKWLFHEDLKFDWRTRRKVILDVAKGLTYLHEDCRKRIIHLDIKPQNILLDGDFNAKKDESQVLTMMRGTRGYLAPEWYLNRRISEKVDVYSFGVVVLETVCGRRNLDYSQPEESECLLHVVKRKAEEDALCDVLDKRSEDMQQHQEEAIKMIRIAIWCLQGDCTIRPSMSMVVKVLEGGMDMDNISDYSFLTLTPMVLSREVTSSSSAPQLPSILSGPR
ncbi:hypothetical protein AQUCO_03900053v1 [Aquilegia coerulea]|uniref:Receptor-like serine/threonine-protein kinase n=1 Tax=Aquilegia coerulea TaxID=218851 RepID=A0A2G5CRX1_AQUCA|nr:hypothetical protein AQUCO_03900053v1 [Aquilegia coerulea]